MINVKVVYDDDTLLDELRALEEEMKDNLTISYLHNRKDEILARKVKSYWAARKDPFAIVIIDNKPTRGFYAETGDNVMKELIIFLKTCLHT